MKEKEKPKITRIIILGSELGNNKVYAQIELSNNSAYTKIFKKEEIEKIATENRVKIIR